MCMLEAEGAMQHICNRELILQLLNFCLGGFCFGVILFGFFLIRKLHNAPIYVI